MTNQPKNQKQPPPNVLIIEDEGEIALVLEMILVDRRYQLDYAKNLEAARRYLDEKTPAIVIIDNKLPDGWGVNFLTVLRKNYPAARIIMISGNEEVKDKAIENGADHFLVKPFSLDDLYYAIDHAKAKTPEPASPSYSSKT